VVVTIIIIMMAIVVPAFLSINGAQNVTKAANDIAGTLEQARAYAMGNNTYVWVGIAEVDDSVNPSVTPQVTSSAAPYGRVAIVVVASKDGTRDYDADNNSLTNPVWGIGAGSSIKVTNGANLMAINKLQRFENVHLATTYASLGTTGNMTRQAPGTSYIIGNSTCSSYTPFAWPLGSALNSASAQYNFTKVINFDPQGVARIEFGVQNSPIVQCMEIGLVPSHGNSVSTSNPANVAAIQIDGMTGAVRIYRP